MIGIEEAGNKTGSRREVIVVKFDGGYGRFVVGVVMIIVWRCDACSIESGGVSDK